MVFNPIDEAQHYAYVESMARHLRPPVVGRDRLSPDALRLVKEVRTSYWRGMPVPPSPGDDRWGAAAESYEGVQGPLYYLLMAAPFRLSRPFGTLSSVYGVRIGTVLVSLLAVPVAYLLARELFPDRRDVWLAAPALLVLVQGFNGNLASVTNDALVVPLAGAALLAFCRSARRGFDLSGAALTGGLVGLGLATKSNMVALVPLVGVAAVAVTVVGRKSWRTLLRWVAVAGATTAAAVAPWLAWNLSRYGSPSASEEVDAITGPLQPVIPRGLAGVREHLIGSTVGFWDFQAVGHRLGRYTVTMTAATAVLLAGGLAYAMARRLRRDAAVLVWLGSAYAVTAATMVAFIYGVFGGRSSTVGRHMYVALVALVVAVCAAAFVAGRRWAGWLALGVVANLALSVEPGMVRRMVALTYTDALVGRLAPVVDQSWGEGLVSASSIAVTPPCPAHAFGVGLGAETPPSLPVVTAAGEVAAPYLGLQGTPVQRIAVYTLPTPLAAPFAVRLDGAAVSASAADRDRHLAIAGEPGDPVARVFCPVDDPEATRFAQQFSPDHPSWLRMGHVTGWPSAWAWAARAGLLASVLFALRHLRHRARRGGPR